jgi:hypothetical protein
MKFMGLVWLGLASTAKMIIHKVPSLASRTKLVGVAAGPAAPGAEAQTPGGVALAAWTPGGVALAA